MDRVALKLVIGPANAEKAGVVLDGYRAALERDPLLVVPTAADVDHYRRELAASGAVFGVSVMRFAWLMREIARRGGVRGRTAGRITRERVAAAAISGAALGPLARSATTAGFETTLLALIDELQEARAMPARAIQALRAWGEAEPARAGYAEDLATLVSGYRRELERIGVADERLRDVAALDGIRLAPQRWGTTPVFVYGFDDLTALQREAIETLACHVGADVTVSLTYEPGREALASRAATFEQLRVLDGVELVELGARTEFYAPASRRALHGLERGLFEPVEAEPIDPETAVRLLAAGGERAEIELVGAQVAALLRDERYAPDDIAVVFRSLRTVAPLVEEVFGAFGIPCAIDRRLAVGHTALGRGLLGLLRSALADGSSEDLLAYLRTPGVLDRPELGDQLEAELRRTGVRTAGEARRIWEQAAWGWPLDAVRRVERAVAAGPGALCARLAREASILLTRPHRAAAAVLDAEEELDARVAGELGRALRELTQLAEHAPGLIPQAPELAGMLARLEVRSGAAAGPGLVAVTTPLRIRARRVRALFACGLQEGAWPAPARPDPLLGDDDRVALARATGLVLRPRGDALSAERYVFYAAATRPTDLLALSWHDADDDGQPATRSFFVDDVAELFAPALRERTLRRRLGEVGWAEGEAPTPREARRAWAATQPSLPIATVGPLRTEPVLAKLRDWPAFSASGLESWASCPMRWLIERFIDPGELQPDPEPMLRGTLAHRVLRDVLAALGPRPLRPGDLPAARAALGEALARHAPEVPISVNPERLRAELRRLEADLLRYLDAALNSESAFAPTDLERSFEAEIAAGVTLRGTIDRIDRAGGEAIVYDYKGRTATPVKRWASDRKLQIGLYVLAVRSFAGERPVGGLYQPLGADDTVPRGALLEDADPGQELVRSDRIGEERFEAALAEVLEIALVAVDELRGGRLEARPRQCAYRGGCAYPSICRCEAS